MPSDTVELTYFWDDPYFEGHRPSFPGVPDVFHVGIAGRGYAVDWQFFQRGVLGGLRPSQDGNALPGEAALNPAGAWKRNRDDWSLGAGQTWSDRALTPTQERLEIEPSMFFSSKGLDPWTVGELSMLPDTEVIRGSSATNMKILAVEGHLYIVEGPNLIYIANPEAASWTATTITPSAGNNILDITTNGSQVFISVANVGMFTTTVGSATAAAMPGAAATFKPTVIGWANGWLFAGSANVMSEIRANGLVNTVFTHPSAGFIWRAIASSPRWIYFSGQTGTLDSNETYHLDVKADGSLSVATFAGSLPIGEGCHAMSYYGASMVMGTTKGIRLMEIGQDGGLTVMPLIETNSTVLDFHAEAQYVWFTWTNYDATSTGVGRLDVSHSTDAKLNVPPYASDILLVGQGTVQGVARAAGRTYFVVSGAGTVRARFDGRRVPSGALSMGRFRWGTYERKTWLGTEVVTHPLNGALQIDVGTDELTIITTGVRNIQGSTGLGLIIGVNVITEPHDWFEPIVTVTRSTADLTLGPVITRITLRALPVPKSVEQIDLPLIMSTGVNMGSGEGFDYPFDTEREYEFLKALAVAGNPINVQLGRVSVLAVVRGVEWKQESVYGLTPNRRGVHGILMVSITTTEA